VSQVPSLAPFCVVVDHVTETANALTSPPVPVSVSSAPATLASTTRARPVIIAAAARRRATPRVPRILYLLLRRPPSLLQ
jgi:hypothetical protein